MGIHKSFAAATEAQIEFACLDYLTRVRKIFCWKNVTGGFFDPKKKIFRKQRSPFALNGVSDIIAIHKGITIYIEVKAKAGRQSDSQKEFESRLRSSGGLYYVVRDLNELEIALDDFESRLVISQ